MEITDEITKRKWNIDLSHNNIKFKIEHLVIDNVKGTLIEPDTINYVSIVLKTDGAKL